MKNPSFFTPAITYISCLLEILSIVFSPLYRVLIAPLNTSMRLIGAAAVIGAILTLALSVLKVYNNNLIVGDVKVYGSASSLGEEFHRHVIDRFLSETSRLSQFYNIQLDELESGKAASEKELFIREFFTKAWRETAVFGKNIDYASNQDFRLGNFTLDLDKVVINAAQFLGLKIVKTIDVSFIYNENNPYADVFIGGEWKRRSELEKESSQKAADVTKGIVRTLALTLSDTDFLKAPEKKADEPSDKLKTSYLNYLAIVSDELIKRKEEESISVAKAKGSTSTQHVDNGLKGPFPYLSNLTDDLRGEVAEFLEEGNCELKSIEAKDLTAALIATFNLSSVDRRKCWTNLLDNYNTIEKTGQNSFEHRNNIHNAITAITASHLVYNRTEVCRREDSTDFLETIYGRITQAKTELDNRNEHTALATDKSPSPNIAAEQGLLAYAYMSIARIGMRQDAGLGNGNSGKVCIENNPENLETKNLIDKSLAILLKVKKNYRDFFYRNVYVSEIFFRYAFLCDQNKQVCTDQGWLNEWPLYKDTRKTPAFFKWLRRNKKLEIDGIKDSVYRTKQFLTISESIWRNKRESNQPILWNNLQGRIYRSMASFEADDRDRIRPLKRAFKIYETIVENAGYFGKAWANFRLAELAYDLGRPAQSNKFFDEGLKFSEKYWAYRCQRENDQKYCTNKKPAGELSMCNRAVMDIADEIDSSSVFLYKKLLKQCEVVGQYKFAKDATSNLKKRICGTWTYRGPELRRHILDQTSIICDG